MNAVMGKQTRVWLKWAKHHRCENTLRLCNWSILSNLSNLHVNSWFLRCVVDWIFKYWSTCNSCYHGYCSSCTNVQSTWNNPLPVQMFLTWWAGQKGLWPHFLQVHQIFWTSQKWVDRPTWSVTLLSSSESENDSYDLYVMPVMFKNKRK